jgi:tetratricopeptide (TPR) repeat protein
MRFASILHLTLRVLLWTGLCVFLVINIVTLTKYPDAESPAFLSALIRPFSAETHLKAAQMLQDLGFIAQAKREIVIAKELQGTDTENVLGASSGLTEILARLEQEPGMIKNYYDYWKSVTRGKPEYRDGFMMAGLYAYRLGYREEAIGLLNQAVLLDANYAPLNTLLDIVRKK